MRTFLRPTGMVSKVLGILLFLVLIFSLGCCQASVLELPEGTRQIEEEAFCGDTSLEKVELPEGLESIGSRAFAGSSVKRIYMPASLEEIAEDAFSDCPDVVAWGVPDIYAESWCTEHGVPYEALSTPLEEFTFSFINGTQAAVTGWSGEGHFVVIPAMADETHTVTAIGKSAFQGKTGLEKVYLPETLTSIGQSAFQSCTGLTEIWLPDGITAIEDRAFTGCTGLRELTLPESLESIGYISFSNCTGLTKVQFNENLVSIGRDAFYKCTGLTELNLPDSLEQMGRSAFRECSGVVRVHYPLNFVSGNLDDGPFAGCTALKEVEFPEGVTRIGSYFFWKCASLTEITLPETLTSIGDSAFRACTGLTEIELPAGITEIGDHAFGECTGLTGITLPESLESIGYMGFSNCTGLTEVQFNENLVSIGRDAFLRCTGLTELNLPDSLERMGRSAFRECTSVVRVHYPLNFVSGNLDDGPFAGCTALKEVEFPEGVTRIGSYFFWKCASLTEITLPETVTSIGDSAFRACTGLTEIQLPAGITEIGDHAFGECTGLTGITLPESLESIGYMGFSNCTGLTEVQFNKNLTFIDRDAFLRCTGLTELNLPDSLERMGRSAFRECTSVTRVHYPLNFVRGNLDDGPFAGCTALTTFDFPEGVTRLGDHFFWKCSGLETIRVPGTVTELGENSFRACPVLDWIYIPRKTTQFGNRTLQSSSENLIVESEYGSDAVEYAQANGLQYYCLSGVGLSFPKVVYQTIGTEMNGIAATESNLNSTNVTGPDGQTVHLSGLPLTLTQVTARLTNTDTGEVLLNTSVEPGTEVYSLANLTRDIDFSALELGHYRLVITAATELTSETLLDRAFEVKEPPLTVDTSKCILPGLYVPINTRPEVGGIMKANYDVDKVTVTLTRKNDGADLGTSVIEPMTYEFSLDDLNGVLPVLYDWTEYRFVMTVEGHGETLVVHDQKIYTTKEPDATYRMADPLFAGDGRNESDQLATWSAYFAMDCASKTANPGSSTRLERCFMLNEKKHIPNRLITGEMMFKDMDNGDGTHTRLFAVGIPGTNGVAQWIDNLNLGNGNYHSGFFHAANYVKDCILEYQADINTRYPKPAADNYTADKIWIAGHSRGAAVANILGGDLLLQNGFEAKNIFCYCFACPNVKKGGTGAAPQVHVYNNAGDLVPKLPLSNPWGYGRYGTTTTFGDVDYIHTYQGDKPILQNWQSDVIVDILKSFPEGEVEVLNEVAELVNAQAEDGPALIATAILGLAEKHVRAQAAAAATIVVAYKAMDTVYEALNGISFSEMLMNTHDIFVYYQWLDDISPMQRFRTQ